MSFTPLTIQNNSRINNRQSNFELLRVFSMLIIVACHLTTQGIGIYEQGSFINKVIAAMLYPGGLIGVPLFFMLTGYFLIGKKTFSLKKVFLETVFYGWLLAFILLIPYCMDKFLGCNFNYCSSKAILRKVINPVSSSRWWFVTAYTLLILVVPYINQFLEKLNKSGFKFLIFVTWIFWYSGVSIFGIDIGITPAFFFFLLGAYFKLYTPKAINKPLYLLLAILLWALMAIPYYFTNIDNAKIKLLKTVLDNFSNIFLIPLASWLFFAIFASLKIKQNHFINTVAATTFGIYLIHVSSVKTIFYRDIFNVDLQYSSNFFPLFAIADIFLLFSFCSLIDYLRLKLIEKKMISFADKLFEKLKNKFFINTVRT